ncbi:hypothetical protein FOS08_14290 [Bacillus pseudomycoides]|uniref:Uncharacterized protein n=1 Tax=Bacillus pseudomycoides TaxID=64104 RepID=A0AAJ1Z464_9BACI|nr:hypothetical protein [Bacillus pseudomycoides]
MKTKKDIHSFSLFVFTRHGAKKGPDRFYPWTDPLFPQKRKVFYQFFNLYTNKRSSKLCLIFMSFYYC